MAWHVKDLRATTALRSHLTSYTDSSHLIPSGLTTRALESKQDLLGFIPPHFDRPDEGGFVNVGVSGAL
eukprot:CAMPEP_0184306236 /NCGR_PEP_ID=MMETSP1049-20130417/15288_1 /TAXON_ID=77928 /ORGANISM="Proteomonas sulcata, Strain CCMP704" /LENGTH=68 /DNA_ID=CAMNT_0026618455 /DNA_START=35 /DNA_END=241 /DNA_ORIENTATION=-